MLEQSRAAYPTFPASCWWPLRERFKRALPPTVTADYLQAVLEVEPKTARNFLPMLRQMGLTDEHGALRARANAWRVDSEYATVCQQICDELYPSALRHAAPDPGRDFDAAVRWFMKSTGVGTAAAKRMARFYSLLAAADPAPKRRVDRPKNTVRPARRLPQPSKTKPSRGAANSFEHDTATARFLDPDLPLLSAGTVVNSIINESDGPGQPGRQPAVQLVVQIQLPPNATAEQIDQLVASIARHLAPKPAHRR